MDEARPLRIGFLGAGKMATALARGWIQSGLITPDRLLASDPLPAARQEFQQLTGVSALADNAAVVRESNVLLLAVKPQNLPALMREIRPLLNRDQLVVSIAAGATLESLEETFAPEQRIIRVMPNTPCLVGAGASAFALGHHATPADGQLVQNLLNAVGRAFPLPEHLLDAVTGLSGSGPAFVYLVIEALSDGGVRVGLPREVATALAAQTVMGAARMVLETNEHTGTLKDRVASPGGTTIAGLHALERGGLRGALMDAVEAATLRAAELAKGPATI
jgi:pyrroline-5-carboxylate reductase